MSHQTDVIERDHYRASLRDALKEVQEIQREATETHNPLLWRIEKLAGSLREGWLFVQRACPQCGGPAVRSIALSVAGPNHESWECPKCGRSIRVHDGILTQAEDAAIRDAGWYRPPGGGWKHESTGERAFETQVVLDRIQEGSA